MKSISQLLSQIQKKEVFLLFFLLPFTHTSFPHFFPIFLPSFCTFSSSTFVQSYLLSLIYSFLSCIFFLSVVLFVFIPFSLCPPFYHFHSHTFVCFLLFLFPSFRTLFLYFLSFFNTSFYPLTFFWTLVLLSLLVSSLFSPYPLPLWNNLPKI